MFQKTYLPTSHECAVCAKYGEFFCERCGEIYCSRSCQVIDWREHRRYCMPIPRLLQRSDINAVQTVPLMNRMLMDSTVNVSVNSYDATDAFVSVSDGSVVGDSVNGQMTHEQVKKLTKTLNEMQIDNSAKGRPVNIKRTIVNEVMINTPPTTPTKSNAETDTKNTIANVDENENITTTPVAPSAKPVIVPPPKKVKNYKPSILAIQEKINVVIVHVESPQTIYVIPLAMLADWKQLIERSQEYAATAKFLTKPPELGHIVLAQLKSSDQWSRALVKRIRKSDEKAQVEFMEYGLVEIFAFSELKCLSEELVNEPRILNMVTLNGIPDQLENADEAMNRLVEVQESGQPFIVKEMTLIEKTNISVHCRATLVDMEKFTVLNDTVKEVVAVEKQEKIENIEIAAEAPQPTTRKQMEYKGFSGKDLDLFILDHSLMGIGYFSAIRANDLNLLTENDQNINLQSEKFEKGLPFYPRDGEVCLAKCLEDDRWYRATSQQKVDDESRRLLYNDYGNMEVVPCNRIRELEDEFFFPCITSLCYFEGLPNELQPKQVKRLKELIQPYKKMRFDEVKYTGEDAVVKSNDVIQKLKNEGLL